MKSIPADHYYPAIDGLRAVAIIMVIIHHTFYYFDLGIHFPYLSFFIKFAEGGQIGVDLFFVISGFLITGVLIKNYNEPINVARFFKRRFFKIYPQYVICLIACILFPVLFSSLYVPVTGIHNFTIAPLGYYLIFMQNYIHELLPSFQHAWSLAVEEHFYLIYPLVILFVWGKAGVRYRKALLFFVLFFFMLIIAWYRELSNGHDIVSMLTHANRPDQTTLIRIDAIMGGCLIKLLEPFILRLSGKFGVLFILSGCFLWSLYFSGVRIYQSTPIMVWVGACGLLAGSLIGCRVWNWCLESKVMRVIGRNSYGLYLWHFPLIFLLSPLADHLRLGHFVIIYLIAVFFFGITSTQTIEKFSFRLRDQLAP